MTRRRAVFFSALAAFIASFFVTAVRASFFRVDIPSYVCAFMFFSPWTRENIQNIGTNPAEYFAALSSGIINPFFVAAIVLLQKRQKLRLGKLLRGTVIALFPACWISFWLTDSRPDVGYFLWTAAMLVLLFMPRISNEKRKSDTAQHQNSGIEATQKASSTALSLEMAEGISC